MINMHLTTEIWEITLKLKSFMFAVLCCVISLC